MFATAMSKFATTIPEFATAMPNEFRILRPEAHDEEDILRVCIVDGSVCKQLPPPEYVDPCSTLLVQIHPCRLDCVDYDNSNDPDAHGGSGASGDAAFDIVMRCEGATVYMGPRVVCGPGGHVSPGGQRKGLKLMSDFDAMFPKWQVVELQAFMLRFMKTCITTDAPRIRAACCGFNAVFVPNCDDDYISELQSFCEADRAKGHRKKLCELVHDRFRHMDVVCSLSEDDRATVTVRPRTYTRSRFAHAILSACKDCDHIREIVYMSDRVWPTHTMYIRGRAVPVRNIGCPAMWSDF